MHRYHYYHEVEMSSRYMCDVLEDMRKQYETRNFSGTLGSIEQLQTMAYRMEAALSDKRTLEEYEAEGAARAKELRNLKRDVEKSKKELTEAKAELKVVLDKIKKYNHQLQKVTKGETVCCDRNADNMGCDCPKT